MEIVAVLVVLLVIAAVVWPSHEVYDHRRDAKTDLVAHKVAKWFHPDKAELLDAELVGRNIVSTKRAQGTDWAAEFDACGAELQGELDRIRGRK